VYFYIFYYFHNIEEKVKLMDRTLLYIRIGKGVGVVYDIIWKSFYFLKLAIKNYKKDDKTYLFYAN